MKAWEGFLEAAGLGNRALSALGAAFLSSSGSIGHHEEGASKAQQMPAGLHLYTGLAHPGARSRRLRFPDDLCPSENLHPTVPRCWASKCFPFLTHPASAASKRSVVHRATSRGKGAQYHHRWDCGQSPFVPKLRPFQLCSKRLKLPMCQA